MGWASVIVGIAVHVPELSAGYVWVTDVVFRAIPGLVDADVLIPVEFELACVFFRTAPEQQSDCRCEGYLLDSDAIRVSCA